MQKIDIQDVSIEAVNLTFDKNPIGTVPTILVLDESVIVHREVFAQHCLAVLKERSLSPNFPFPCYILCTEKIETEGIPQLRAIEDAPKHFIKKIKRLKNREQVLLSKANTHRSRIENHSVTGDLQYLKRKREDNHKLRDLCAEKRFCMSLLEKIKSTQAES